MLEFTNLDWEEVYVGSPITKSTTYTNTGIGTITNLVITIESTDPYAIINGNTVTISPNNDWISPDEVWIQNSQFPQYNGDETNQVKIGALDSILRDYRDTCLYCFSMTIGKPAERLATFTATAKYKYTVMPDPTAIPPILGGVEDVTTIGVYTIMEKKDLDSARAILAEVTAVSLENQKRYKENDFIPL